MVRLTVTKTKDDDIDVIPYLDLPFSLVPSMEQLVHLLGPAAACPNRHSLPAGRLAAAALLACTVGETRRPSGSSGPAPGASDSDVSFPEHASPLARCSACLAGGWPPAPPRIASRNGRPTSQGNGAGGGIGIVRSAAGHDQSSIIDRKDAAAGISFLFFS